jgi:cytochrome b pre-mRNA-processing protein 3
MILHLFRRTPQADTIARLYGAIVAQARRPEFYRDYGVPDTVNGRFEMLVLHAVLLLGRLAAEEGDGRRLGQDLFDHFCGDMDANLREMGVGDSAVPRKMKAIGEAFYGRKMAYEAALAATGLEPLAAALNRNVYGGECGDGATRLAAYMRASARALAVVDGDALRQGSVEFVDPLGLAPAPAQAVGSGAT